MFDFFFYFQIKYANMNIEGNSKVQVEEQRVFIEKGSLAVVKTVDVELKSSNLQNNGIKEGAFSKDNDDLVRMLEHLIFFVCQKINGRKKFKYTNIKTVKVIENNI